MKLRKDDPIEGSWKGGNASLTVEAGSTFFFNFHRHGSVGEDARFEIVDRDIIEHVRTETHYKYPERMKPGWTGGDAEAGKWFFKALKPGETKLIVQELFRFEVEETHVVDVTVTN